MAGSTSFVYTLSSEPRVLVQQATHSVRTLLATTSTDAADVHLFFTPPVDDDDLTLFEELGVTVHTEPPDFPGGFRTRLGDARAEYAEKWKLTSIESDTVVFLDCDTIVLDDLTDVASGSFDFKARPMPVNDEDRWRSVFDRYDEPYRSWYPNAGFLVFKEGYHREIRDQWEHYIRSEIPYYVEGYTKEQFALSLATAGCDFEAMTPREHVMEWTGETRNDGYLYHVSNGDYDFSTEVLNAVDGRLPARAQDVLKGSLIRHYDGIL